MPTAPQLRFFCELEINELETLFEDDNLISQLQQLQAGVCMGIRDLTDRRAQIVQKLTAHNIPVTAWLLLPRQQGYWINAGNTHYAAARYREWKRWTDANQLEWEGIGIDIEPDRREIDTLLSKPHLMLIRYAGRIFGSEKLQHARNAFNDLIYQMHRDGYSVEAYHLPIIVDEQTMGSTVLGRWFGLLSVPADREVLMLYSSFFGPGILWEYAPEAQAIAIGSTGRGVDIGDLQQRRLSIGELTRDLRMAAIHSERVYIFSLEGCVEQGYLERISSINWDEVVAVPQASVQRARMVRQGLRVILWLSAHRLQLIIVVLGIWLLMRWGKKSR